jgi:ribA/ribD-fused uncharacterized protein
VKPPITSFSGRHRFLSNFYPVDVVLFHKEWGDSGEHERFYPTVEHAYHAAKTTDQELRQLISEINRNRPQDAKAVGRKLHLRPDWEQIKLEVMLELLRSKFCSYPCRELLLQTDDAELIEGNWWGDTFWGVCNGVGENHLGRLLMQVRTELKEGRL